MKAITKWFNELCKEQNLDPTAFDLVSMIDRTLSVGENKRLVREIIGIPKETTIEDIRVVKDKKKHEADKEADRVLTEWKAIQPKNIIDSNNKDIIKDYLKMIKAGNIQSLIVFGKTGLGKTYTVINIAKEEKIDFVYRSGYTTPLALYKFMYENRDKVILFDDLEGLFNNELAVALLKSALWEADGKRIVSYETTAKGISDVPRVFEFTGKIIILTNRINGKKDEHFKALLSRTTNFELIFTYDEMMKMCGEIIESRDLTDKQRAVIRDVMDRHINPTSEFNYRMLDRLIEFVKYDGDKAEELFMCSHEQDDKIDLVFRLANSNLSVGEQVKKFYEQTGSSRMTYFRIKKYLKSIRV